MTGLLLAFTGRAVAITNQYDTNHCVAHAVATCGSLYGYIGDSDYYVDKLQIGVDGYHVRNLTTALLDMNITRPKQYSRQEAKQMIKNGPLLVNLPQGYEFGTRLVPQDSMHLVCGVGYNDVGLVIADSSGTGANIQGYAVIPYSDIHLLTLQSLGYQTLTPSLITLTEQKEELQESKRVVKSVTIKGKSTRKRFLKPLD